MTLHYIVEAVEPFKLHHSTPMPYIHKVFEHLQLLWMSICLHTHTITATDISPDLGELTEIQGDVSVETIPLGYGWDSKTFQTVPHIHVIHT